MSAGKASRTCDECKYDGGQHYSVDDQGNITVTRCPNYLAAEFHAHAIELTAEAREKARDAAREIVKDAAQTRLEFSANDLDEELDAAQIPSSLVGGAFTWAESEQLIVKTERTVPNRKKTTRKPIHVWRSRIYRGQVSA